jgi:hypothetical protein
MQISYHSLYMDCLIQWPADKSNDSSMMYRWCVWGRVTVSIAGRCVKKYTVWFKMLYFCHNDSLLKQIVQAV